MGDLTNAEETELVDRHLRAGRYFGLLTAITDAEAGTVTEATITTGEYERKSTTSVFGGAVNGVATNPGIIRWDKLSSSGTVIIAGYAIFDAATGGTVRGVKADSRPVEQRTVLANQPFEIGIGLFTVSFD